MAGYEWQALWRQVNIGLQFYQESRFEETFCVSSAIQHTGWEPAAAAPSQWIQ